MSGKISLVHILPSLDRGGAEKITVDLLCGLNKERFAPQLILFKRGGFWEKKLAENKVPVTVLKKRGPFDLFNFWQLCRSLAAIRPLIVHTHLGGDIYGRLAAKLLGIPLIVSTEHNVNYHEKPWLTIMKRLTARWADKVVAVSLAVKADMAARYHLPEKKTTVIYNGLNLEEFSAKQGLTPQPKADRLILGTIGRLSPQKGHLSLIEAAKSATSRNWLIKIAGRGEQEKELVAAIKKSGLENQIQLVGALDNPADFLGSLDAFIFPSLWEGLGIAVLEAAATGLPIIASRADGLKEILDDTNSFGFKPGSVKELAEQIDWLSRNFANPLVKQKALAAQQKVRQKFALDESVRAYEKLYEELLETALKAEKNADIL